MEQTLGGLRNYEENARATESRIRDVDVAMETTQYSKYQILVQIGTAMMAQANAMPQIRPPDARIIRSFLLLEPGSEPRIGLFWFLTTKHAEGREKQGEPGF